MGTVYQQKPTGDHHHPLSPRQASIPQQLPHRPSNLPQSHPNSPHPNHHLGTYPSPHSSNNSAPLQRSPYPQPPALTGPIGPELFYQQSPYDPPIAGQFAAGPAPRDIMAATHMQQRPYQQSVYHTPQSNSPASVASSQGHDQHARLYGQPPPQMPQQMYTYPQYQVPQPAYPQHPGQQPQMMTSQPLMPHQPGQPLMPHQSPAQSAGMTNSPRPQTKLEAGIQRPMEPSSLQRSPAGPTPSSHNTPASSSQNANGLPNGLPNGQSGGQAPNPNAAPGPIPATTPLVVRQDNNGVQWIAFEYSRDRVKMEYTIRCDVESVNTDNLSSDFRTDNCVYPRACCTKDTYKGNRLQYENECNTVGWALAELNPCLRGKRGLIQRAVDSWRNSNQDPRLRSRRVRRMAKMNTRKSLSTSRPPSQVGGPRDVSVPQPNSNQVPPSVQQRAPPSNVNLPGGSASGPTQLQQHHHHAHAHPDGSQPGTDNVSVVNGDYEQRQQISHPSPAPIRPSNIFHGNQAYPTPPNPYAASMPPQLHNGIEPMPSHVTVSAATAMDAKHEESSASPEGKPEGKESKERKFFTVEDPERSNHKVRVKLALHECPIHQAPDSYRKKNSVFPRSWFPQEMQLSPSSRGPRGRFLEDREESGPAEDEEGEVGTTFVRLPLPEGREGDLKVPGLGRRARKKDDMLNDMGYRISWSNGRTFPDRILFLQQSLDVYRARKRETLVAKGQDVATVAPVFETRVGKKRWTESRKRGRGKGARE